MRFLPPSRLVPSRCALAILIVVHGAILRAQPAIAPGTRVRVAVAAMRADTQGPWRVGRFLSRTPTTLTVDTGKAYYAVGAVPGAIAGGAIGARRHGAERWQQVWAPPPAGSRVP